MKKGVIVLAIILIVSLLMQTGCTAKSPLPGNAPDRDTDSKSGTQSTENETVAEDHKQPSQSVEEELEKIVESKWKKTCSCGKSPSGKDVECSYAIPRINLKSADVDAINNDITQLFASVVHDCTETQEDYIPAYYSVDYECSIVGDILSVCIVAIPSDSCNAVYRIYTVSLQSGHIAGPAQVINESGMRYEDYLTEVKYALGSEFWNTQKKLFETDLSQDFGQFYQSSVQYLQKVDNDLQKTISPENLEEAIPYFDENGDLTIYGRYYVDAAAGFDYVCVNLETYERSPYYCEKVKLPEALMKIELTWDQESDGVMNYIDFMLEGSLDDGSRVYIGKMQDEYYVNDKLVATVECHSVNAQAIYEVTLYDLDGVYTLSASAGMDPDGFLINSAVTYVNISASVHWLTSNQNVVCDYRDADVVRGGTGVWVWCPFRIDHGQYVED